MMTIFEKATIDAAHIILHTAQTDYATAWTNALSKYTNSEETLRKGCPRSAFVDVCRFGYVKGIPATGYGEFSKNGSMAIEAIRILQQQNWSVGSKQKFWRDHFGKAYESQLDVVLALKNAHLLHIED